MPLKMAPKTVVVTGKYSPKARQQSTILRREAVQKPWQRRSNPVLPSLILRSNAIVTI